MRQTRVPHFDFPMRFDAARGQFAVVEQDTLDDIYNCVHVALRARPGQRELLTDFGTRDVTFSEEPIDLAEMQASVRRWEPRADVAFSQMANEMDALIVRIRAEVTAAQR